MYIKNMTLEKYDIVKYIDAESGTWGKANHITKYGIWDGEKVVLDDKERTTVHNPKWLDIVVKKNFIAYFDNSNPSCLIFELRDGKKVYIAIPPGKDRVDLMNLNEINKPRIKLNLQYLYGYEGLIITTTSTERILTCNGYIICKTKLK